MRTALVPSFVLLATLAAAQAAPPPDPAVLQQRLADKLAQPFLRHAAWHTDWQAAQRAAARDGKLILAHFTRSFTPCGTSIRCERDVLATPEFAAFADRVVLWCHVTAHVEAAADRQLAAARGSGWPHHAVFDATGRLLGSHESHRDKTVAEFATLVDDAIAFLRLEAELERDLAGNRHRLLTAGLAAGALELPRARALFAQCGALPADETARLAAALTDLEVADVLARHDRFDTAAQAKAGAEFLTMWRHGKRPAGRNAARDFWGGILLHQEQLERPDLDLHRAALAELEARFGEHRGYRTFLAERRTALERLRSRAAAGDVAPRQ
jgi:hypothetical protein